MKKWLAISLVSFFFSCQEEEFISQRDYPFVRPIEVHSIDETGASISFEIVKEGKNPITAYGAEYLEKDLANSEFWEYAYLVKYVNEIPEASTLSVRVSSDLLPGQTYVIKPFVEVNGSRIFGLESEFVALGSSPPEVTELNSRNIGMRKELIIKGKNFSQRSENNRIEIPGAENIVDFLHLETTSETLRYLVSINTLEPLQEDNSFDLVIKSNDKTTRLENYITLAYPKITEINTLSAKPGTELIVTLKIEEEREFMYLAINFNLGEYLLLPLERTAESTYRTHLTNFPPGEYQLGLLMESIYSIFPEPFEVLPE